MGDVEAEGLYDVGRALVVGGELLIVVGGEELVLALELRDVVEALEHVGARDVGVPFADRGADLVRGAGFVHFDYVVGDVVDEVDGAGGSVEDDVVAVELVLVDQRRAPFLKSA